MTTELHRWTYLHSAMASLSAACDGAHARDDQGFSAADASIGHYLGDSDVTTWDLADADMAAHFATYYKRQLGIDSYRDLVDEDTALELAEHRDDAHRDTVRARAADHREERRATAALAATTIAIDDDLVVINGPYNADLVAAQRAIPGRRWNGSTNTFPLTSLPQIIDLAASFDIAVPDDVAARAATIAAEPVPAQVTLGSATEIVIDAPYSDDLRDGLYRISGGRTWDSAARVHRISPAHDPAQLLSLLTGLNLAIADDAVAHLTELADSAANAAQVDTIGDGNHESVVVVFSNIDIDSLDEVRTDLITAAGGTSRWPRYPALPQIPLDYCPAEILTIADTYGLTVSDDARMLLESAADDQDEKYRLSASDGTDPELDEPVVIDELGITLMPHQHVAVRHASMNRRVIIADDMGLGKTYESLAAIAYDNAFPAVVACKPDLIGNWVSEITKALPQRTVYIAESMTASPVPEGTDIVVIGFNALSAKAKNPVLALPEGDVDNAVDFARPADVTAVAAQITDLINRPTFDHSRGDVVVVTTAAQKEWRTALDDALADLTVGVSLVDSDVVVTDPKGAKRIAAAKATRFTWAESIGAYSPKGFIIDEGHLGKEATAARSQAMEVLGRQIAADNGMILDLTGTPLVNRPKELAQQLVILGHLAPKGERGTGDRYTFGEFGGFLYRYCGPVQGDFGWTFNGASHLDELHTRLRSWGLYLRRRTDILHDLPEFSMSEWHIDPDDLDPTVWETYQAAENETVNELRDAARKYAATLGVPIDHPAVKSAMASDTSAHLPKLNKLRQIIGTAKLPIIEKWVADKVADGEKVMVAAHHRPVVSRFAKQFGGLRIQGEQTRASKDADKARFQDLPVEEAPVISVSIGAGGVGHTLTAARYGIQAEQVWTPGEVNQMAKRIYRIGQERDVTYTIALVPGTIDERMWTMINDKQTVVSAVLDGEYFPTDIDTADAEASAVADVVWDYVTS